MGQLLQPTMCTGTDITSPTVTDCGSPATSIQHLEGSGVSAAMNAEYAWGVLTFPPDTPSRSRGKV